MCKSLFESHIFFKNVDKAQIFIQNKLDKNLSYNLSCKIRKILFKFLLQIQMIYTF